MSNKKMVLRSYDNDPRTVYLELVDHPHELVPGIAKRTVAIHELIPDYDGPYIALDFNDRGKAIGIEILYPLGQNAHADN
jgi:hypothetical protein